MEKNENIDQYLQLKGQLNKELILELEKLDRNIEKQNKKVKTCLILEEKIEQHHELLFLRKKAHILRTTLFSRQDLLNGKIDELMEKL